MKRKLSLLLVIAMLVTLLAACGNSSGKADAGSAGSTAANEEADAPAQGDAQPADDAEQADDAGEDAADEDAADEDAAPTWKPTDTVNWINVSSAGGGADIWIHALLDVLSKNGISDANFVIQYITEGGGEVGRTQCANEKNGDYWLMAYSFGDMTPQLENTDNRLDSYRPIMVACTDQLILLANKTGKYQSLEEAVEAMNNGETVSVCGSKGVDPILHGKLIKELGVTEAQMPYVQHAATSDAIISTLGDHCDFVISKPAACLSYVESGDLIPIVAFQQTRFGAPLDVAPTMEELGYNNIEAPMWRGLVGPKSMSDEAYAYYCDIFAKALETEDWTNDYITPNLATPSVYIGADAEAYMLQAQTDYLALLGKDK